MNNLDEKGREIPDPTPMEMPIGFSRPLTIQEQIRRMVQTEVSQAAAAHGAETWEESDDFATDDDIESQSPYELDDEMDKGSLREFIEERPKTDPSSNQQVLGLKEPPAAPQINSATKKRVKKPVEQPDDNAGLNDDEAGGRP